MRSCFHVPTFFIYIKSVINYVTFEENFLNAYEKSCLSLFLFILSFFLGRTPTAKRDLPTLLLDHIHEHDTIGGPLLQ
jgi:hypothetical protein